MKRLSIPLICLIFLLQGCGYSFYGRKSASSGAAPNAVNTVFLENIVNLSSEAHVETWLRNAFLNRLIASRNVHIAENPQTAEATIKISIRSVIVSPLSLNIDNTASQVKVTMLLSAEMISNPDGFSLWQVRNFSKSGEYATRGSSPGTSSGEAQKQEALTSLCRDVSDHLYSLMFSGF